MDCNYELFVRWLIGVFFDIYLPGSLFNEGCTIVHIVVIWHRNLGIIFSDMMLIVPKKSGLRNNYK